MKHLPTVLTALDGSVGLEILAFDGVYDIADRAASGCSYRVRSAPSADAGDVTVVFAGAPDRVRLHAYDLALPADDQEALQTLALASIGEFLDEKGLPLLREDAPFKIECVSTQFKSWRDRGGLDDDQIEQYIRSSLYWSWRFAHDEYEFSAADALRLGVSIQQLQRIARLGEDVDWVVTGQNIDALVLRPTQQLLRTEKSARSSARNISSHPADKTHDSMSTLRLFISHSSRDVNYVATLIDLLRSGLNLPAEQIRCTSVDGYRLPAGADAKEALRKEIHSSEAFIGVVSKSSLQSQFVMFELGARWGAGKHLIPLLAPGTTFQDLSGPISGLNALEGYRAAHLHQLVQELAAALNVTPSTPAAYQRQLDDLLAIPAVAVPQANSVSEEQPTRPKLSLAAEEMLRAAAADPLGTIDYARMSVGTYIESNGRVFGDPDNPRDMAKWEGAIRLLREHGLIWQRNDQTFDVTEAGYDWADRN